jgi:hypothetical protein
MTGKQKTKPEIDESKKRKASAYGVSTTNEFIPPLSKGAGQFSDGAIAGADQGPRDALGGGVFRNFCLSMLNQLTSAVRRNGH